MGLFSSFVSGVCDFVSSTVSSIGRGLANIATSVAKTLSPIIDKVISVVKSVGVALGIIEQKDNIEEFGAKACQSDLKPEDFDSTAEYIAHLKNDIELDKEKFEARTKEDKLAHKCIGVAIVKEGIKEKSGVEVSDEFLSSTVKNSLSSGEVLGVLNSFKLNGFNSTSKFDNYMKNSMSIEEKIKVGDIIVEGLVKGDKNTTKEMAEEKLENMELKSNE